MKFDKDFVLKHQFWMLLGVFGVLWLASLVVLFIMGGGPTDVARTALEDITKKIEPYTKGGPAKPKNASFTLPWDGYGADFKNHKNTVWNIAWSGDEMDVADAELPKSDDSTVLARRLFRSSSWEVKLLFDRTDQGWRIRPDSTIKNIDGGHHDLSLNPGVQFRLRQDRPDPPPAPPLPASAWDRPELTRFAFDSDKPVPWDQTRMFGEGSQKNGLVFVGGDPTQPIQLQQIVSGLPVARAGRHVHLARHRAQGQRRARPRHAPAQPAVDLPVPRQPVDESHLLYGYKGEEEAKSPYRKQFQWLQEELKSTDDERSAAAPAPPDKPLDAVAFRSADPAKDDYYGLMSPVDINSDAVKNAPSPEECWLMQEDFWVKRELLYVVRDAMNLAAHMDNADAEFQNVPLPDPKVLARRVYRNDSWEVTLLFDHDSDGKLRVRPDSTIKNIHVSHREQFLGVPSARNGGAWFRLWQGGESWPIAFEGVPVAWGQEAKMSDGKYKDGWSLKGNPDPAQMELDQLFDATNTPITRIDAIAIPYVSDRNANIELFPTKLDRYGQKAPPAPAAPAGAPSPGAAPNPNAGGSAGGTIPSNASLGPPGMSGSGMAAAGNKTPNYAIERNRYIFVTDQSRHLPVAMTLTLDQSHLPELLAAFANSKLRFQTTQVEFRRVPAGGLAGGSTQPNGFPGFNPNGGVPPGMTLPPTPGATGGSRFGPPTPNGVGPTDNPGAAASAPVDNPNLIEVTVYGIASLYERPDAR